MEVAKEKQTDLETKAIALAAQADAFEITDSATYSRAVDGIDKAKAFQKEVKAVWDPVCDAANKAHKTATAGRADQIAPFIKAEKTLKKLCDSFDIAQEKLRREAQKKIDDEKRQADEDKRKKEADALARAEALEAEGKTEEAEAVIEQVVEEVEAPAPAPAPLPPPAPKGVTYIDNWKAIIVEPALVPRQYCVPDQSALNKHAKEHEDSIAIPGVQFQNDRTIRR